MHFQNRVMFAVKLLLPASLCEFKGQFVDFEVRVCVVFMIIGGVEPPGNALRCPTTTAQTQKRLSAAISLAVCKELLLTASSLLLLYC